MQDRDAGHLLTRILRTVFPTIRHGRADSGYAGKLVDYATILQIVSKLAGQTGFIVLPDREAVGSHDGFDVAADVSAFPEYHRSMVVSLMLAVALGA